ncbi:hypothetical protein OAJ23_02425 [Pelagibacteraceae bacterium]|nr:hypothetical protein [Pelagibacteraceae bacterium]
MIIFVIYFSRKNNQQYQQKNGASSLKYIGVWFLWNILSVIPIFFWGFIYGFFIPEANSIRLFYIQESILYFIIYLSMAIVFVKTYERFKDIKIRKVMPYLWVLGLFGCSSFFSDIKEEYSELGIDPGPLVFVLLFSYIIANLSIRYYFRNSPHWDMTHITFKEKNI